MTRGYDPVGESDWQGDPWDHYTAEGGQRALMRSDRARAKVIAKSPYRWDAKQQRMVDTRRRAMNAAMTKTIEHVLIEGDLSRLSPEDRVKYYLRVCESVGLNPLTKPFKYIRLHDGKETLYATKDAAEQLRSREGLSLEIVAREILEGVYVVTARARTKDGRVDDSTGAVAIDSLKGENRANAMMKAETKAKRRVTLSICGLGMPDESEIDSIPGAIRVAHDEQTGEVRAPPPALPAPAAVPPREAGPGLAVARRGEDEQKALYNELRMALERCVDASEHAAAVRACKAAEKKGRLSLEQAGDLRELSHKQADLIKELAKAQQRVNADPPAADMPAPPADEELGF